MRIGQRGRRRRGRTGPSRRSQLLGPLFLGLTVVAGSTVVTGCGSPGPPGRPLSDAQVERWLAAVQQRSTEPGAASRCYLVTRSQLAATVTHPPGAWVAEGFNDQTTDARRFAGCAVRAVGTTTGPGAGDGEIGVELTSAAGRDPDPHSRQVPLPRTRWTLTVTSWPGTGRTSAVELRRVERAVLASLAVPPGPSAAYADPSSPLP